MPVVALVSGPAPVPASVPVPVLGKAPVVVLVPVPVPAVPGKSPVCVGADDTAAFAVAISGVGCPNAAITEAFPARTASISCGSPELTALLYAAWFACGTVVKAPAGVTETNAPSEL